MRGLSGGERIDELWRQLTDEDRQPVLVSYTVTEKDTAEPFIEKVPKDYREKAMPPHSPLVGGDARALSDAQSVPRAAGFLRKAHETACGVFSTVLGPEANEAHRNHLHFDLAPRTRSPVCERASQLHRAH